ncbi:MAG: hypothetical protein KDJ38_08505, partial [Gammaproteobacteria bacterium]|nr:hypothetical protein [Gammaproteobacteria bacterium]
MEILTTLRPKLLLCLSAVLLAACSAGDGSNTTPTPGQGPGIGGGHEGTGILPDMAIHSSAFKGDHYSGSGQCTSCHNNLTDQSNNDVSLGTDWSSSMMANATRDPYWIAKVAAEIDRHPELKGELDDTCSRCHAPMANDAAKKDGVTFEIHGENGLLSENNPYFDHAMEGVSCTICHQIEDNGKLGTIEGDSGNFSVQQYENQSDRPAFGPYADASGAYMLAQSQFNPVYSAHITTSESCAVCHDLRTPSVDGAGHVVSDSAESFFPEQMVYSEWKNSDFQVGGSQEKNCQSCHMPEVEGSMMLATEGGGIERENFSRHTFLGPNTVMQTMLKNYSTELGIELEPELFDESIARNREFLKGAATVDIVSSAIKNDELVTKVKITNLAGHKLPSGYPSRRAYLRFVVTNSIGEVIFESGRLRDNGSLEGVATDTLTTKYEPHYETITSEDQVQVYEAIMGNTDSAVTHTLLRATHYLKDNRLLPAGFDKQSAPDDIKVAGFAASDSDFDAGGDTVVYRVPVSDAGGYNVLV